jgi:hypothetical protein
LTGAAPSLLSSRVICHHDHLVVATLVTCRAFGLPRCFRSLGKLFPLCPEASAGCDCRRAAAAVADLVFQRCYCSLGKLSPSRPPLLEVNARRCGGFPGCRPLSYVGGRLTSRWLCTSRPPGRAIIGMLTVAEETLTALADKHKQEVKSPLYGQEINPETYRRNSCRPPTCRARRDYARRCRTEPTSARQAGRPTATCSGA